MNLSDTRQELADALSTANQITGFSAPPSTMAAGDAFPTLVSLDNPVAAGVFEPTWSVWLILGGSYADAIDFLDQVLASVIDALLPVAWVESVTPRTVQTPAGELQAAELRLTR